MAIFKKKLSEKNRIIIIVWGDIILNIFIYGCVVYLVFCQAQLINVMTFYIILLDVVNEKYKEKTVFIKISSFSRKDESYKFEGSRILFVAYFSGEVPFTFLLQNTFLVWVDHVYGPSMPKIVAANIFQSLSHKNPKRIVF